MRLLQLDIEIAGEFYKLDLPNFSKVLNKFGKEVIRRARISLSKSGKNSTGNLSESLGTTLKFKGNSLSLTFDAPNAPYWQYVDKGVQGKIDSSKAPNSPFKFGSGTGQKGGLRNAIRSWIDNKPIKQWKSTKSGRFMSYDQMTHFISRSVYLYGIEPSYFYTDSFLRTHKKYLPFLEDAYSQDYAEFFDVTFAQTFNVKISF